MSESDMYRKLVKDKKIESVMKAKGMEKSLSNGRKIFRLFLFLNEISAVHELLTKSSLVLPLRVLKVISGTCSFIYYLTDNIIWLQGLGFVGAYVPGIGGGKLIRWKRIKNMMSLTKTVLEIFIALYNIFEKERYENEIREDLDEFAFEQL